MPERTVFETYQFSLIICKNPKTGKYLAINETKDRGWWIPGGAVDAGESFKVAAHRECMEEAGVPIILKGILAIDHFLSGADGVKMRVIYYAEPVDQDVIPKQVADKESLEARWVTLVEFTKLDKIRGHELLKFGGYIEKGGTIHPMSLLNE